MEPFAAIVLAGGAGRRMGGPDKPRTLVGGRPMRDRVLDAVTDADVRVLVGPATDPPPGVLVVREDPPGGGPVAATAAGVAALDGTTGAPPVVALLAADLPLLTGEAVDQLRRRLERSGADGVCHLDDTGRRQSLCGVWRLAALRSALRRLAADRPAGLSGAPLKALLAGLAVVDVPWSGDGPPPWFDCDTVSDVRRAEEWTW